MAFEHSLQCNSPLSLNDNNVMVLALIQNVQWHHLLQSILNVDTLLDTTLDTQFINKPLSRLKDQLLNQPLAHDIQDALQWKKRYC